MSQLLEDALSRDGVAVTRAACPEAAGAACAACLAAGLDGHRGDQASSYAAEALPGAVRAAIGRGEPSPLPPAAACPAA